MSCVRVLAGFILGYTGVMQLVKKGITWLGTQGRTEGFV